MMRKCGFVLVKHETEHLSRWTQKYPNDIMGCIPLPTMGATKEINPYGV
jgi:hypothetical protein